MDEESTSGSLFNFLGQLAGSAGQAATAALQNKPPQTPAPVATLPRTAYAPIAIIGGAVALVLIIAAVFLRRR